MRGVVESMPSRFGAGFTVFAIVLGVGCTGQQVHRSQAALVPLSEGLGYLIEGSITGKLVKDSPDDPDWQFSGAMNFSSGLNRIGRPLVTVTESSPQQVEIIIPLSVPPHGAAVPEVLQELHTRATVTADDNARFTIIVETTIRDEP